MKKKVLSLLLAVAMVLSMIVLPASAAEAGACPQHPDAQWTEVSTLSGALTTGHYKLTADIALTAALTVAAGENVCIDLAGKNLTQTTTFATGSSVSYRVLEVIGGTLTVTDSVGTGVISGGWCNGRAGASNKAQGGNLYLAEGATFNLYGGTISGGKVNRHGIGNDATMGGNIYANASTVNIFGGTVADGIASSGYTNTNSNTDREATLYGGNISVASDSVLNISGGTISGGKVENNFSCKLSQGTFKSCGGNIHISSGSTATISGGTISGGAVIANHKGIDAGEKTTLTANAYGGNISLVGSASSMTITGGTISNGSVSASTAAYGDGTMTMCVSAACGGNIYNAACDLTITGGIIENGSIVGSAAPTGEAATSTITPQGGNLYCGDGSDVLIGGDAVVTSGTIMNDITAARGGNVYIADGGAMTLEGNAQIVNGVCPTNNARGGNIFVVEQLTINGGTIANGAAGWGSNMMLQSGAKIDMNGGTVTGGTGGTSVLIQRGTFTMTAGTIGNPASKDALAVQGTNDSNGGTAYIYGGTVGNLSTNRISQVYVSNAELGTINNGAIATLVLGENVVAASNTTPFQTGEAAVEKDGKFTTYVTLTEALAATENTDAIVYMAKDISVEGDLDIYSKLELNGFKLTAAGIIDASNKDAAIIDSKGTGSAVATDVKLHAANGMLGLNAQNNGVFTFEKVIVKQELEAQSEDTAYLKFIIDEAADETLLDDAILAGGNIKIRINVTSPSLPGGSHSFVYEDAMVDQYVQDWGNKMFTCTINGLSQTEDCTITAQVVSEGTVVSAKEIPAAGEGYYNTKWDGKTLKVLCVGNSFARNSTKVLYQIAEAHGVEEITLGLLYIGGCSVETHWKNAQSGSASYTYYKNTNGTWEATDNTTLLAGLQDEEWDVITITQGQGLYGIPTSYDGCLEELVAYINTNKTNAESQIAFHMTWAFPKDSTIERFSLYNYDQDYMFRCIADTAQNRILTTEGIDFLLPAGSAIQNARTALGDIFSDDDRFHLGKIGEYVAGYTWFSYLTGQEIDELKYIDPSVENMTSSHQAMLDAINAAFYDPFTVTQIAK